MSSWDRFVKWVMSPQYDRLVLALALYGLLFALVAHFAHGR